MKGLTQRQREVFDFIREFIRLNRYPPTIGRSPPISASR